MEFENATLDLIAKETRDGAVRCETGDKERNCAKKFANASSAMRGIARCMSRENFEAEAAYARSFKARSLV